MIFFTKEQQKGRPQLKDKKAVVITDLATKKTDLRFIRSKKPKEIVSKTKSIYNSDKLSPPKLRMMTDQGKEFQGEYKDYVQKELKVKHIAKPGKRHGLGKIDHKIGVIKESFFDEFDDKKDEGEKVNVESLMKDVVNKYNSNLKDSPPKTKVLEEDLRVSTKTGTRKKKTEQQILQVDEIVKLKEFKSEGKFKKGEQRWSSQDYRIYNVLLNPDCPPRYILLKYDVNKKKDIGEPDNHNPVHYKNIMPFSHFVK